MRQHLRLCAIAAALLASAGIAAAQVTQPGAAQERSGKLQLSPQQKQSVDQGLSDKQAQSSAPAAQAQVGTRVPDAMTKQPMPDNVTAQVPETQDYLFVKLPDRVLLIDPDSNLVAEIIPHPFISGSAPSTTGRGSPGNTGNTSPGSPETR